MSDFEREIVNCLNRFFKTKQVQGFAFRLKSQKPAIPCADVLVDSSIPAYNLSIECKSIIDKKLYFSQHFHAGKQMIHPVDAISEFLAKTGRIGYLAIEFRKEPGKANEAFLVPWGIVVEHFRKNQGISLDEARNYIVFRRSKDGYTLEDL
ncbi:MAG: Holliday junction resolvase [Methanoregula sp.]|nr:Holliday junction resolvase [Methanoregula sp.]